jgi:hypothetical protein
MEVEDGRWEMGDGRWKPEKSKKHGPKPGEFKR